MLTLRLRWGSGVALEYLDRSPFEAFRLFMPETRKSGRAGNCETDLTLVDTLAANTSRGGITRPIGVRLPLPPDTAEGGSPMLLCVTKASTDVTRDRKKADCSGGYEPSSMRPQDALKMCSTSFKASFALCSPSGSALGVIGGKSNSDTFNTSLTFNRTSLKKLMSALALMTPTSDSSDISGRPEGGSFMSSRISMKFMLPSPFTTVEGDTVLCRMLVTVIFFRVVKR
mmetsp:Transcript_2524/g.3855  ORF Transcript_2524/g.3855 Transcript_2524/m.3855 type:complete len:228 (-) Transcript_2524:383-1066(-)